MRKHSEVRLGVIGCGSMAQNHMEHFRDIARLRFVAASDTVPETLKATVDRYQVKGFADADVMIDSGLIDAVLIATPHLFHPIYAKHAFEHGLHVLTEKPVAVRASEAIETNQVHASRRGLVYAVMFQMRTQPKWKLARDLIHSGQVGAVQRIQWTVTDWFRTNAYYRSGSWRATWAGEGGGVLMNQCPHNLDLLCWLFGRPRRIYAQASLGKYHSIEVEDEVTAVMEFPNAATGVFVTSTGEYPGTNSLEIAGDRGRIVINKTNTVEFVKCDASVSDHSRTTQERFVGPQTTRMVIEVSEGGGYRDIHQNFVNAILDGEPVIAAGEEGLYSVEVANAMIYSSVIRKPVDCPIDPDEYNRLLKKLIQSSSHGI